MVKVMALVRRKPGLSPEEFLNHYEEVHAPLALKHFPTFKRYVRNHVITPPDAEEPEFNCITEIWFADMEGFNAMGHFWASDAGKVIRDDEDRFIDGRKSLLFLVDEKVSK